MLGPMDNKTWFVEVAVVACVLAGAMVAFTLMTGHTLYLRLCRK